MLSLSRFEFLIFIIFLLSKEILVTFLTSQNYGNKFPPSLFVWKYLYFSFTFEEWFHRAQNTRLVFSSHNALISFCSLPVCNVSEEKLDVVAQSCLTLCDPMGCSPPGSTAHGSLQARILEWIAISFSRQWSIYVAKGHIQTVLLPLFDNSSTQHVHFLSFGVRVVEKCFG